MIEPIFEGARARCKRHPLNMLPPNEIMCDECKIIAIRTGLKPPFWARCDRTHFEVKKGEVYKVAWIIAEGTVKEGGDKVSGYMFRTDKNNLCERVYSPTDFTPIEFLTAEEREKLGFKEEEKPAEEIGDWYG